jgi:hypothetical protein
MRYPNQTRLACGSKEFYPPFPFPPGESRGGDGSPHAGTRLVPANGAVTIRAPAPPARGISKRSAEIPLARSPCGSREDVFDREALAGLAAGPVQHHLVLGMAPLAGFEVITDGRF